MPLPLPPLVYLRALQNWEGRCGLWNLFAEDSGQTAFVLSEGQPRPISWTIPQEFISVAYSESIEATQARRQVFDGSNIQLDDPLALEFPDRYLATRAPIPDSNLYQRGQVEIDWLLNGVFEIPKFCIGLPLLEQARTELGLEMTGFDVSKAALTLKPRPFDILGVFTADRSLCGALEIATHLTGNRYLAHFLGLSDQGRELEPGETLFTRYEARIGETHIAAERKVLTVIDAGSPEVPPLELPKNTDGRES